MTTNEALLRERPNTIPVVAADLEGTISAGVTVVGMYRYLRLNGRAGYARRSYMRHVPEYFARNALGWGLREFKNRWMLRMFQAFAGYSTKAFDTFCHWLVEDELWPKRREAVVAELLEHQAAGRRVIIVTGVCEPILRYFLEKMPGIEGIGTPLLFENGRFTGNLATSTFNVGESKRTHLQAFSEIYAAYGDTGPDEFMLAMSQNPVAVHPDKRLRHIAQERQWRILENGVVGKRVEDDGGAGN